MKRQINRIAKTFCCCFLIFVFSTNSSIGQKPTFKVLAFYTTTVENDHVDFANNIIPFYQKLAVEKNFTFDTTTSWSKLNDDTLSKYQVVVWINEFAQNEPQRRAFENFINKGGAWLGFHVSAYNDKYTKWPWFVEFLGGGVFYMNNWPPLPAKLIVDDNTHPVTKGLPKTYIAPINEWYIWKPSVRVNKDVKVLVTLDPSNYPI
ncbi:MAG: ThuA domain-containing protein, partial [Bacteroidota bacterium]